MTSDKCTRGGIIPILTAEMKKILGMDGEDG